MNTFFDISMPLVPNMVTWPGEPSPTRVVNGTVITDGNGSETSTLTIGSHTGTHIDAPRHFVADMEDGVDSISLEHLNGMCHVVEILGPEQRDEHVITVEDLKKITITHPKIIFKTANSKRKLLDTTEFDESYVCLGTKAAEYLVEQGVHFVGVDYLSVERKGSPGHPVHVTLLKNRTVILEGAYVQDVPPGDYWLTALPLRLIGSDGSPTRAILRSV